MNWWDNAVVYQIYPRSFLDSNGDGIGDLGGIACRIDYLQMLGVDAVWLSPFYPSPLADGGYDVVDYRDVDPRIGTLDDFDRLVSALHDAGIRIIVDIVPNHTSDQHPWFQQALAAPKGSPERARYHFVDGKGPGGGLPPNDWESIFGGPMWHPAGDGQWYLHIFAPEQPDLNWENPEVRADFDETLRFWFDRGVDGVRVDAAPFLVKDLTNLDLALDITTDADTARVLTDREEIRDIYAHWGELMRSYDPPKFGVAEVDVLPERRPVYAETLGQAFNFDLQQGEWTPDSLRRSIAGGLADLAACGSTTWVLGCHDVVRLASRRGFDPTGGRWIHQVDPWLNSNGTTPPSDLAVGTARARASVVLEMALPGSAYVYQGDELGLPEVADLPREALQDPTAFRTNFERKGRDGCRVPLPWAASEAGFGFTAGTPHLPQPEWFADYVADSQVDDPSSMFSLVKTAIELRRTLDPDDPLVLLDDAAGLRFTRGDVMVVASFDEPVVLDGELLLTSAPVVDGVLPPNSAAWVQR